ncbi:MAG: hypothetical protein Q7T20_08960 [Saprospiraceae bacterium]|nr:hypothetical protein [Saprospiraceae bacterium]
MQNTSPFWNLERGGLILSIAGLFVTIYFAIIATRLANTANTLAQKSLELTQNDSLQDLQLRQLTHLYENSQLQLLKQDEMLKDIGGQLATANRHYALDARIAKNVRTANLLGLRRSLQKLHSLMPPQGEVAMKALDPKQRLALVEDVKNIVEGELQNAYLISRKDAFKMWSHMSSRCYITEMLILTPIEKIGIITLALRDFIWVSA